MMGAKTCTAGLMGEGGRRCWNRNSVENQGNLATAYNYYCKAALTVIGNRAAQRNAMNKSARRDEKGGR